MGWLDTVPAQLSVSGLLAAFIVAILFGRLIPRSWAKTQINAAQHNAELWQQAAAASDARADRSAEQTAQLLAQMSTLEAFVRAIVAKGQ